MPRTLHKAGRDLLVLLVATAAWYLGEHVADLGLPEGVAPLVGAAALMVYRLARARVAMPVPKGSEVHPWQ